MHTYREEANRYTVYFEGTDTIRDLKNCPTESEAQAWVSFLNGGPYPDYEWIGENV